MNHALAKTVYLADLAPEYLRLREAYPDKSGTFIMRYLQLREFESFEEFCERNEE